MFNESTPRPCSRCGAGNTEYISSEAICSEFHMAYGVVAWLCLDCRSQWYRAMDSSELGYLYERAMFALEFWKARINKDTPDNELDTGLELHKKVHDLETQINAYAHEWLIKDD